MNLCAQFRLRPKGKINIKKKKSISPGASGLVDLGLKVLQGELAGGLHQQLDGEVGDDVLEEGLVRRHLGLLHHGHVGTNPGAEHKL